MKLEKLNSVCAERLRKCIDNSGMKDKDVAKEAGFTPQHISNLVNGKARLTADTARILSSVLKVKEDYLLGEDDYPTNSDMYRAMIKEMQKKEQMYIELIEKYGYKIIGTGESEWKTINIFKEHIEENNSIEINKRIEETPYTKYVLLQSPNGTIKRMDLDRLKTLINDIEDYIKFQMERCFEQPQPFRML